MICQVYAPLEDLHRSLYIFCCNRRRCSLASQGWIVLRNQAAAKVAPATPPATAEVSAPVSAWSFLQDEQIQTDALQQMLQLRDESLVGASASTKSSATTKVNTAPAQAPTKSCVSQEWRPCRRIVEVDDSWAGKSLSLGRLGKDKEQAAVVGPGSKDEEIEDDEDEEGEEGEEEEDYEDSFLDASVASDARVQEMLAGYLKDEADEELAAMLSRGGKKKGTAGAGAGAGLKEEKEEEEEQEQGWMRKLWRNSPRAKVESHFQQRVACEPQQVLRYAYGGEPLWCTYPPPPDGPEVVEACRHCGAKRCFEMQLMPALLALREQGVSGRETPRQAAPTAKSIAEQGGKEQGGEAQDTAAQEYSSSGSIGGDEDDDAAFVSEAYAKPTESQFADLLQRLGDGMDFGVLSIYSCPESCQGGNEECVVVQPPSDIAS